MKTIYHMPRADIKEVSKPVTRLMGVIIRNYNTKYAKALKALKDYLDGTPHINKYCRIKIESFQRLKGLSTWDLYNVKPENLYVFPYTLENLRIINLLESVSFSADALHQYVICPIFYINSKNYPIEFSCGYGSLLVDDENADVIMEHY